MPLLAASLLVAAGTLNRALRKIENVAVDARAIRPSGAESRLAAEGLPSEIRRMWPGSTRLRCRWISTKVVRDAVAGFAPLTIRTDREMEMRAPLAPVLVKGNAHALVLAVTNLVENALLHTPAGTPIDITVSAPLAIDVLDRGPGVRESERKLIVERVQRTRGVTAPGTGLGLSIVSEIARRHGATATVEQCEGGGSVFTIRWQQ